MRSWSIPVLVLLAACSAGDGGTADDAGSTTSAPATVQATETDGPSPDPPEPVAGDHRLGIEVPGGFEEEYLLHAPPAVERGRKLPLVLAFHGNPGSPEEMARMTGFDALADDEGFLVAYPDGFSGAAEVGALIDHLVESWRVDPRRVYATGFSRGASATYVLAEDLSDRIAAFAPVSGVQFGEFQLARPVPLITFQGGRDQFADSFAQVNRQWARAAGCGRPVVTAVRVAGSAHRSVAQCGAGTEHIVYDVPRMGHVWPRAAGGLIWEFFSAHPLAR